MTKQLIKEAKRFQELAGINEVKIQLPTTDIAKFLEEHDDEVSKKIFEPLMQQYGIPKEIATYYAWTPADYMYGENTAECSIESEDGQVSIVASLKPYDTELEDIELDPEYSNSHPYNIAGRNVYIIDTDNF
jgi:hypothetical protein